MKEIAILGATASGKSNLAISLAKKFNFIILSLDSLSIYKEINIASAKPTLKEMQGIMHFGIDELYVNEAFNVVLFFEIYKKAKVFARENNNGLIIVGGSSFYLKSMLCGISQKKKISEQTAQKVAMSLRNLENSYELVTRIDKEYAKQISKNDKYRIEKWLEIYFSENEIPSHFLKKNKTSPLIKNIKIYEILTPKEMLLKRVIKRTNLMFENSLVDEVFYLEKKYSRSPNPLKSIGIKEVLEYLDGNFSLEICKEKIIQNTMGLAKRQQTFNKTQFNEVLRNELSLLEGQIEADLSREIMC